VRVWWLCRASFAVATPARHPAMLEWVVVQEGKEAGIRPAAQGACLAERCFGDAAGEKILRYP